MIVKNNNKDIVWHLGKIGMYTVISFMIAGFFLLIATIFPSVLHLTRSGVRYFVDDVLGVGGCFVIIAILGIAFGLWIWGSSRELS